MSIILVLVVPLEIAFVIEQGETNQRNVKLVWLFGTVKMPLRWRFNRGQPKQPARESRRKVRRSSQQKALSLFQNAHLRQRVLQFLKRLIGAINVKSFDVHIRLGLDDPADTGRLWGAIGPMTGVLAGCRKANICIAPDFDSAAFALQSRGRFTFVPLKVIFVSLCFFLSPTVFRAIASER